MTSLTTSFCRRALWATCLGLLSACSDSTIEVTTDAGDDAAQAPLPQFVAGIAQLHTGRPAAGALVTLLDTDGREVGAANVTEDGSYTVATNGERHYRVNIQADFDGGTNATGSLPIDLRGPGAGMAERIVLPDFDAARLAVAGDQASSEHVTISGLPDTVTQAWAQPFGADDTSALPGPQATQNESFVSGGYVWLGAADSSDSEVTQFSTPLTVTMALTGISLTMLRDETPDNGQIDIAMSSYDEAQGRWQREADGVLIDTDGNPVAEARLAGLRDGNDTAAVRVQFTAPHFSCWSISLFHRVDLADRNDANALPGQLHLRPTVPFNRPFDYTDFWLGGFVSGESEPLLGDIGDDSMLVCGSETWVEATYRRNPSTVFSGNDDVAYLQVFQVDGNQPDIEGDGAVTTDFGASVNQWVLRNFVLDDFSPGFLGKQLVRLPARNIDQTEPGTGVVGQPLRNHRIGHTRLMITHRPITEQQAVSPVTQRLGETEDYLDGCNFFLRVGVNGGDGDELRFDNERCTAERSCRERVGLNETVVISATQNGTPVDVDWSGQTRTGVGLDCPTGPTCSFRRTDGGRVDRFGGLVVASFPTAPEVRVSVRNGARITDDQGQIDCDARDVTDFRPRFSGCQGIYEDGTLLTLTASSVDELEFVNWDGAACMSGDQTAASCTFALAQGDFITPRAVFARKPLLSVTAGSGGRVVSDPAGIDCGRPQDADCEQHFASGTVVTLTALPDDGQGVLNWTGACASVSGTVCEITMDEDTQTAVNFVASGRVTMAVEGLGAATSTPAGIDCATGNTGDCDETIPLGFDVQLDAAADPGWGFVEWTGICATATFERCIFNVQQDEDITARFGELFDLDVQVTGNGGAVDGTSPISHCEAAEAGTRDCQGTFTDGTQITLNAIAFGGNEFVGWGGDCAFAAGNTQCTYTLTADSTVTAAFREVVPNFTLTLRVTGTPGSAGDNDELLLCNTNQGSCQQDYARGSDIGFFAVPDDGSHSFRWGESCSGTPDGQDCAVTDLQGPINVSVEFFDPNANAGNRTLKVSFAGTGSGMVTDNQFQLACSSAGGSGCTGSYAPGTEVGLSAFGESTQGVFVQWLAPADCTADATNPNCTVTMDADKTATAEFRRE